LAAADIIALVNLDVQGAYDGAILPAFLKEMSDYGSFKYLYKLKKNYFTERTAILATSSIRMEKEFCRECPQASRSAPRLLEFAIQHSVKDKIHGSHKSVGICGLLNHGVVGRVDKNRGKLHEHRT